MLNIFKNITLCIILVIINATSAFSYLYSYKATIDVGDRGDGRPVFGEKYETVQIRCLADRSELVCRQPGTSYECSFASATWCECCDNKIVFQSENGDELFDHAQDQITLGQLEGTYTNNIYREPLGLTIYRSVTWNVDMTTLEAIIEITISDGIE